MKKHNHKRNKRSVLIPRIDRDGSDLPRIPAQVMRVCGNKDKFYEIATKFGIIETKYRVGDLEVYEGIVEANTLIQHSGKLQLNLNYELHQGVKLKIPMSEIKCNCKKKCSEDKMCECFKALQKCTHCHISAQTCCY